MRSVDSLFPVLCSLFSVRRSLFAGQSSRQSTLRAHTDTEGVPVPLLDEPEAGAHADAGGGVFMHMLIASPRSRWPFNPSTTG